VVRVLTLAICVFGLKVRFLVVPAVVVVVLTLMALEPRVPKVTMAVMV
jgi:hypothetical protein